MWSGRRSSAFPAENDRTHSLRGMAGLLELARAHTPLRDDQIDHLQRLAASWGLLADLCFADLLLFAPLDPKGDEGFIVIDPDGNPILIDQHV